jgi:hypothetical protein
MNPSSIVNAAAFTSSGAIGSFGVTGANLDLQNFPVNLADNSLIRENSI